jgi:hypothetical protein
MQSGLFLTLSVFKDIKLFISYYTVLRLHEILEYKSTREGATLNERNA